MVPIAVLAVAVALLPQPAAALDASEASEVLTAQHYQRIAARCGLGRWPHRILRDGPRKGQSDEDFLREFEELHRRQEQALSCDTWRKIWEGAKITNKEAK